MRTDWEWTIRRMAWAPIANGARHERHRDDRRTELAGITIKAGTTAIMGIKGQVDHCAHGRTVSVLTGCCYHDPFCKTALSDI